MSEHPAEVDQPDAEALTEVERVLVDGELTIHGRIMPASNATFFAEAVADDVVLRCVYKPIAGERPLWDFPHGTLAGRELAAYVVSSALGWDVVPLTVLRDGPEGPGMVQLWCEPSDAVEPVDLVPVGTVPAGFRHVLDAEDGRGARRKVRRRHERQHQPRQRPRCEERRPAAHPRTSKLVKRAKGYRLREGQRDAGAGCSFS